MHNTSNDHQTPKPNQSLANIACWFTDLWQQQDVADQEDVLQQIKLAYLCSTFADCHEERNDAIGLFTQLEQLIKLMYQFSSDDLHELNKLTLKLLEQCTTETQN